MHALMNRWDRIFDGIRKGKNAGEIYRREGIIAQKKYEAWANKRGERSEEKFERSIKSLSFVVDVRQTVKNSDEDYHQKIDFWVVCDFGREVKFPVSVQVKPSMVAVRKFLRTYRNQDLDEAWKKVVEEGMVVINCDLKPWEIRKEFTAQVMRIKDHKKIS